MVTMTTLTRWLRHGSTGSWQLRQLFPTGTLARIESAIKDCESLHTGEIRFAVEAALPLSAIWRGQTARERAVEVFARHHVWDTEHNNGVLIYVLIADHDVEIVADRGVGDARVPAREWEDCCHLMEAHFRAGRFEAGALEGIAAVAAVLTKYPPAPERPDAGNEMPDQPILL